MKMNIIIALALIGMIGYGIYSLTHVNEGWEGEQGWALVGFGLAIAVVFYISTRDRVGK